ncbi:MAG: hypothetical protein RL088_605 [Verrucomicrobiota bacterium]|jgi:hypothetical protein
MKRSALLIAIIALCSAVWFAIPPAEHAWRIADASFAQERRFSDWFHSVSSGQFAIRVVGHITEAAVLETPLGTIDLPGGAVDYIAFASEAWASAASLRYSPTERTRGELQIIVCLGSSPSWIHRPPPSALPALYTGGWTAYYRGTDKKAWSGGFHHGIRWGDFTYWDEAGNITHREVWENGQKKG